MAKTLRERFIDALIAKGEKIILAKTSKYVVLSRTIEGIQRGYYYVGKSGAIRTGVTATSSIPVSNKFKAQLLGIEGTI